MPDGPTGLAPAMMYPRMWQLRCWVNQKPNPRNVVRRCDEDAVKRARDYNWFQNPFRAS